MADAKALWAKKTEINGKLYWLPLYVHLEDTMNVAGWLWDHWLCSANREYISGQINPGGEDEAEKLIRFLGAVHDIGKATPAFQIEKSWTGSSELDVSLKEQLEKAGFSGISNLVLDNPKASPHALAGEAILKYFGIRDDIGSIVGAHHGKPIDIINQCLEQTAYPANYFQVAEIDSDIHCEWENLHREILDWALDKSGYANAEDLPCISKPGQILLSGLMIMADWIASSEEYFPLIPLGQNEVGQDERFRNGISKWFKNMPLEIDSIPSCETLYENRFGFAPSMIQQAVYHTVEQIEDPGIVIIEAPMGCGKTEAALSAAEQIAQKTGRSGLFFGLPTQATSNSMFDRVVEWLDGLADENGTQASIHLSHANAALNKTMSRLASNVDIDGDPNGSVSVNEWFSGRKKTALDDFVVGTVDNFLLAALKQKHLALRHLGLSQKIVIIDEVHAYDTYMQQYLETSLTWMGAYDVPVILLSATLPSDKRISLIKSYLKGRGIKKREIEPDLEKLKSRSYPLISYSDGGQINMFDDFRVNDHKSVKIRYISDDEVIDKIEALISGGGVIGVVVNTVKRAQALAHECANKFGGEKVMLLHSAFIAADRMKKENDLIRMIGKNGKRPEDGMIVIGTQVIEQSLDIDFDVMISDLCPVDLLIQRIGRLQRHSFAKRPDMYDKPEIYIVGTSDEFEFDKGSSFVYGDYYLARTQYYLGDEIDIPSDIPDLVQNVYSDSDLDVSGEIKSKYEKSCEKHKVLCDNEKYKARTFRIKDPNLKIDPDKYNMIGLIADLEKNESEEKAAAQVRDIQETIEVIAVKKTGSGYGMFGGDKDISEDIEDSEVARELAKQTLKLPHSLIYMSGVKDLIKWLEDYNISNLSEWQKQSWLKGSLGIVFNEDGEFELGKCTIKYDDKYGLSIMEKEDHGTF